MDHAACFSSGKAACRLLHDFQSKGQGKWPVSLDTGFERFAVNEFHRIKTFAILFSIMDYPGNIRMLDLRCSARLAQKSRTGSWIFGQLPADDFEGDD